MYAMYVWVTVGKSQKKQGHSNFMWCLVVSAVSSAWTAWTECNGPMIGRYLPTSFLASGAGWKGRRPSRSQPANGSSPQWNWQVNHTTLLQQIMPWQMPRPMLIASTTSLLLACALSRHLLGCINSCKNEKKFHALGNYFDSSTLKNRYTPVNWQSDGKWTPWRCISYWKWWYSIAVSLPEGNHPNTTLSNFCFLGQLADRWIPSKEMLFKWKRTDWLYSGWWFQIFFVYFPLPGEKFQFDHKYFFKWVESTD